MNMKKGSKNSEIKRLILAKRLYLHGSSHASSKDEISRMLAIHNFDNAIEIILKCIATRRRINPSRKYFHFEELLEKLEEFPLTIQIRELHNIRNTVQHQGDIPSLETVTKYEGYVEDFFREIIKEKFGISYDELYLSELIENKKLKEKVLKAEKAFEEERYIECIKLGDDAFIAATFEESDVFRSAGMLTGYWSASDDLKKVINRDYAEKFKEKDFYEFAKDVSKTILQLGQASTSMQFLDEYRIDFLKYRRVVETLEQVSNNELKEKAGFSLKFVTNLVLKWQEEGIFRNKQCVEE